MGGGRRRVYDYGSPETFASENGRRALRKHIARLKNALESGIDNYIRRYCCLICCCLFRGEEVDKTFCKYEFTSIMRSKNMSHVMGMELVYPSLDLNVMFCENDPTKRGIYICRSWCAKRWSDWLSSDRADIPICTTLQPLRPLAEIPLALRGMCGIEAGTLSIIDMSVNLGGGVGRGHYFALEGDVRTDEDLCGCIGTTVGRMKLSEEDRIRVTEGMRALRRDGAHEGVRDFLLTGERTRYDIGMSLTALESFRGVGHEGRGNSLESRNVVRGHAVPRSETIARPPMRSGRKFNLRAGILYKRADRAPKPVFWDSDVEAMLFPQLYLNGIGGYIWTSASGISWEEHVMKRLWNVNPMFRNSPLYLAFMFDFGEKMDMHRTSTKSFIPDDVDELDAEEFCFMSERTARGFENVCRRDLGRGRRGVAAASYMIGKPNIFQTETMNEADMKELKVMSFRLVPGGPIGVDDVTTALMYKYRQIVLMEVVIPKTSLKEIVHGSIRLEVQSGRSYRLHAHNMLRVRASDEDILRAVSASLSSLPPAAREAYEPVSRHYCLSYKCVGGCPYGYPVLQPAERTHRVFQTRNDAVRSDENCEKEEGTVVYKREIGSAGMERDERVTPFCVELCHARVCHGAFMVCNDELATGYSGKYSFKRSGGLGSNVGQLSLGDVVRGGDVQLLRREEEGWKSQMMREKLGMRIISIMEIALHLCGEGIVYSTYFLRELWIVLPYERKKFLDKGVLRKGIPGGAQLRDYYRRKLCFESESFESYYGHGCVCHPGDYEHGVRTQTVCRNGNHSSVCQVVLVKGLRKTLLARVMPIRGRGKFLVNMGCWSLMLRNVPHRRACDIWDHENGEASWDAAAKCGALGENNVHLRGKDALRLAMSVCNEIEDTYGKKMGLSEHERERVRDYFHAATTEVLVELNTGNAAVAENSIEVSNRELGNVYDGTWEACVNGSLHENEVFGTLPRHHDQPCTEHLEEEEVAQWRNRFRSKGWVIRTKRYSRGSETRMYNLLQRVPPFVKGIIDELSAYPSQAKACVEILDGLVESPEGLRRFITGAAGRGKSYLKKALLRIFESVGLRVQVLAVAALVAQDDGGTGGATIASAFNMKGVSPSRFDEKAYEHSKTDIFLIDEISFASIPNARAIEYYLARGLFLREGGIHVHFRDRKPRHLSHLNHLRNGLDPWSNANIIAIGDFMQLRTGGGEAIFSSERLWGTQFRRNTLFLTECVRSSDPGLMKLCDLTRNFSLQNDQFCELDALSIEILDIVRSRSLTSIGNVPLNATVLSPRFERVSSFCDAGLIEIGKRRPECDHNGWGDLVYRIKAEDYVVGERSLPLRECIGMENERELERIKSVLDKDHTRLRCFTFRIGMKAVVTENEKISRTKNTEEACCRGVDELMSCEAPESGTTRKNTSSRKHRLLNGERIEIVGVLTGKGNEVDKVIGVKVKSLNGRFDGVKVMRMTRSNGEALMKSSILEQISVTYKKNERIRRSRVARRQVPLILDLALTVHKAQGSTLGETVVDLGCDPGAYAGGLFYTAISRVRRLADLNFIDVPADDVSILRRIRACDEAKLEMERCAHDSEALKMRSERVWNLFTEAINEQ